MPLLMLFPVGALLFLLMVLFVMLFGAVIFALYVASIVWSFVDAEHRGKSGCLVAILVALLSWPLGLLLWVVFRPEERRP